jgi:hypothetical protein
LARVLTLIRRAWDDQHILIDGYVYLIWSEAGDGQVADYYQHEAELEGRPAPRGSDLGTHDPRSRKSAA